MNEPSSTPSKALMGELQPGTYWWCIGRCSKEQPFCDGSHLTTTCRPVKFVIARPCRVSLCGCKQTRNVPFCDKSCEGVAPAGDDTTRSNPIR